MSNDFEDDFHDEFGAPVEKAADPPLFGGAVVDNALDDDTELKPLVAQREASAPPRQLQEVRPQQPLPVVVGAGSACGSAAAPAPAADSYLSRFLGQGTLQDAADALQALKLNVDAFCSVTAPHAQVYASRMRDWKEFIVLDVPDLSTGELQRNVEENISYFQANYLMIMAVLMVLMIIAHPPYLICVAVLATVWGLYVAQGGLDPAWKPTCRGVELKSSHRLMLLYAGTMATIFVVIGETLLVFVGALATLMVIHSALHPSGARVQAAAIAAAVAGAQRQADNKA